ncbi:MAG: toxic anion resistance protein, partial [Deinococcota bacterium]
MAELAPPETLTPPEPIKVIEQNQADEMVKLDQEKIPELDAKVDEFINQIMAADVHTPVFEQKVKSIHSMGNAEIRASANVSNRMLERPANSIDSSLFDDKSPISKSLVDLRNTVEDLDPSRQGDMFRPRKLLGLIPMGNRVRNYFLRYQSSQKQINAILESLYRGQDELRKDNAAIEQEKVNLWALMQSLRQYI